jgi:hypothetical protein
MKINKFLKILAHLGAARGGALLVLLSINQHSKGA